MSPRTPIQNTAIRKESRRKIMDAAFLLVASNGYEATSIAMIAKEAGVSKGLLYNYFSSKEELIKALVLEAFDGGDKIANNLISEDPRESLRNLIIWFFNEMREHPEHWRLITELTLKIEKFEFVHDIVATKMVQYVTLLESILSKLGYDDALGEARLLTALFDGIGIHALMIREDYPLDAMERFLTNKYCN
jgi:AcrR family transcriptional regulator